MLDEGTPAPDATFRDHDGREVTLGSYRGRWVVLWWFPKAFTAG